jgi:putative FmdB family regulatory protein
VPTYQYTCTECGEPLEEVQKFSDDPLTVCPVCGGKLRKVFSAVGIVFKGSGFYRTDSRGKEPSSASSASSASGSSSSASSDSASSSSDSSSLKSGSEKSGSEKSGGDSSASSSAASSASSSSGGSSGGSSGEKVA